jgi:hypothetical protein
MAEQYISVHFEAFRWAKKIMSLAIIAPSCGLLSKKLHEILL